MKEIVLAGGKGVAKVDDEIFEVVRKLRWHGVRSSHLIYARTSMLDKLGHKFMLLHHLVLGAVPEKGYVVDHIDGDGLNNQRANLRILTRRQNTQNQHRKKPPTSKYPGVSLQKNSGKWITHIYISGKPLHVATSDTEEEAFAKYKAMVSLCGQTVIMDKTERTE